MVGNDALEDGVARIAWYIRGWWSLQMRRHDGLCVCPRWSI